MKTTHICIIGAGTASAISLLSVADQLDTLGLTDQYRVTVVHDPNIPTAQVGESTSGMVYDLSRKVLGEDFAENLEQYDGTLRYYTRYNWAPATGKDFSVYYHSPGVHLNSATWSDRIFKLLETRPWLNLIEAQVTEVDSNGTVRTPDFDCKFDWVIDCRGTPSAQELATPAYNTDVFETVNSVILYPHFHEYNESNTSAYIHDNGWMFGVPLSHRKAFGYLYNNKITTTQQAKKDFARIKQIDTETLRSFSWQPYMKTKALDGRVLSTGNRLYLLEPQQAIPLHYYLLLVDRFLKGIINGISPQEIADKINGFHIMMLDNIQNLMALNYCGPNKLESEFWTELSKKARQRLTTNKNWQDWMAKVEEKGILGYAPIDSSMMRTYLKGFNIDLSSLKAKY